MKARVCACLKRGARSVEGTEAPGCLAEEFAYYCPFGPCSSRTAPACAVTHASALVNAVYGNHPPGRTRVVPVATSTLAGADHSTHAQSAEAEVADTSRQNTTSRTHEQYLPGGSLAAAAEQEGSSRALTVSPRGRPLEVWSGVSVATR